MPNKHLVILKKQYLDAILDGRKTVESRFAKTRRAWFGKVKPGDKLFLKASSRPVCATAKVEKVISYEDLSPVKIAHIEKQYNKQIIGPDEYWKSKRDSRYGMLVWLGDVEPCEPIQIKKRDWRAWVVLTEKENFGLLNGKED